MNHDALRRAAILITTLDTASADALLNEMSPEQATSIRNAIMELGDIDIVEQEEIIEQFVGGTGAGNRRRIRMWNSTLRWSAGSATVPATIPTTHPLQTVHRLPPRNSSPY